MSNGRTEFVRIARNLKVQINTSTGLAEAIYLRYLPPEQRYKTNEVDNTRQVRVPLTWSEAFAEEESEDTEDEHSRTHVLKDASTDELGQEEDRERSETNEGQESSTGVEGERTTSGSIFRRGRRNRIVMRQKASRHRGGTTPRPKQE